jgi:drug/metabolite transporter (DMT)-like permease
MHATAAAFVTVVLWASAFVAVRAAGHDFTGGPLAFGRLLVASVVLGLVVLARHEPLPARRFVPGLVICGVLWFGIYNVALNEAERRVDAGTAAMLVNVGPILIALIAGFVLHEGFPRSLFTGCAVAFAGVVTIGLATSADGVTASWGAVLCLVAALTYAGGVVAQKPLLDGNSALMVTWIACTVGAVVCLPFGPQLLDQAGRASGEHVAAIAYLGVFPTAIAFTTWAYALARSTAGRTGSMTYLVPPLVVLMGWLVLSETPPLLALPGGVLCLVGAGLARRG